MSCNTHTNSQKVDIIFKKKKKKRKKKNCVSGLKEDELVLTVQQSFCLNAPSEIRGSYIIFYPSFKNYSFSSSSTSSFQHYSLLSSRLTALLSRVVFE